MKTIHDDAISYRDACPNCRARFRESHILSIWEMCAKEVQVGDGDEILKLTIDALARDSGTDSIRRKIIADAIDGALHHRRWRDDLDDDIPF